MSKTIAVCGSTGQQGGAVLNSLIKHGSKVRALTRSTTSEKAEALAAKPGVTCVEADFEDVDSLIAAFEGCDGVFAVTDFFAGCGCDPLREEQQVKNLVDAANQVGIKHFVYSSLESTVGKAEGLKPLTAGYPVPHFDSKNKGEKYMFENLGDKATALITSIFYENFLPTGGFAPRVSDQESGTYALFMPIDDIKCSWCSTEDIGNVAAEILMQGPEKWGGKSQGVSGDHLSLADIAAIMTEVLGKKVIAITPDTETYIHSLVDAGVPEIVAADLGQMCAFYVKEGMMLDGIRSLDSTLSVYPDVKTLQQWLETNKSLILSSM